MLRWQTWRKSLSSGRNSLSKRHSFQATKAPRRHDRRYPSPVRSSSRPTQEGDRRFRWRPDLLGRRPGSVARGGTPARPGRDVGGLHPGLARPGAGGAHAVGNAALPHVRDRLRIRGYRGLRRPAHRSPAQAGRGPGAGERPPAVLAAHHEPAGERPDRAHPVAVRQRDLDPAVRMLDGEIPGEEAICISLHP